MPSYKLRSAAVNALDHHVAKLNIPQFDINSCVPPLKLYRGYPPQQLPVTATTTAATGTDAKNDDGTPADAQTSTGDAPAEKMNEKAVAPYGGANKKRSFFKRKTRLYTSTPVDYDEQRTLKRREMLPWILEDDVGDVGFIGRLEGDVRTNYVLFVYENGGFTVIPVKNWYKFNQRITYRTLTMDEAEERMKDKSVNMDRWMMHRMKEQRSDASQPQAKLPATSFRVSSVTDTKKSSMKAEADEMLFDDVFEDDEEYGQAIGEDRAELDDETERRLKSQLKGDDEDEDDDSKRKSRSKLRAKGQDTKKLLKKMKQEFHFDSDDEEKDPYAFSDGEEVSDSDVSEEEAAQEKPSSQQSDVIGLFGSAPGPSSSQSRVSSRASSPPISLSRPMKKIIKLGKTTVKTKRPYDESVESSRESSPARSVVSDQEPTSKKVKTVGDSEDLIKSEEVISLMKQKPQWETKEIIKAFKKKLKKNERNKTVLTDILQRIATKVSVGVFQLQPEYNK